MGSAADEKGSDLVALLTSSGLLKFVGGLVVGAVLGALGGSSLGGGSGSQAPAKKAAAKKPLARPPIMAPREELKMVLCVNQSLNMGKGKIGAQCAHAAVGVLQKYRKVNEPLFRMWERFGQPKITLKVPNEEAMAELAHKAMQSGLPAYIVHDAGRTQVAAGSQTVLAIGPGYKSDVDKITGGLPLL